MRTELTVFVQTLRPHLLGLSVAVLLFGIGWSDISSAADLSRAQAGANAIPGLVTPPGDLERVSKPGDVEAQLREIENTKKLMKALGELHGQGADGVKGRLPGQPGSEPAKSAAEIAPLLQTQGNRDPKGLELPGLPTDALRALGKEASQAARAVGLDSGSNGAETSSRHADVNPADTGSTRPSRAPAPGDEERYNGLLESLIEEIGPWVIAFVVVFFLGYIGISWLSARAQKTSRKGDRGRSGSRRKGSSGRRSGSASRPLRQESIDRVPQSARNGG